RDPGAAVRRLPASALRQRPNPCRQEGAEALSPRLDAGPRAWSTVREPGRRAPAQVGPLRAGRPRARRRAPLLPRHGPPRGGLRGGGEAGADPPRRVQVGRRRTRPEPPLSEGAVPAGGGVADQRGGQEGLPDAGRDPCGTRRRAPADARLSVSVARGGKATHVRDVPALLGVRITPLASESVRVAQFRIAAP